MADGHTYWSSEECVAPRELVGRTIRFNRTRLTPPYRIVYVEQLGPHCLFDIDGSPVVAEKPWGFALLGAVKVPALFLATLAVCLPALYVLNVVLGWKLRPAPTAAVLVLAIAGTAVVLGVLAPIVPFFTLLTNHYHFMMLLCLPVFALAGA